MALNRLAAAARKPLSAISRRLLAHFKSLILPLFSKESYSSVVFKYSTSNLRLLRFFAQARPSSLSLSFSPVPLRLLLFLPSALQRLSLFPLPFPVGVFVFVSVSVVTVCPA